MAGAGGGRHGETPVQQQRRVWDEAAPSYDRQMALFERMLLSDGRAWVGRHARGRVLEVAVGTGLSLPHYPADVTLTGVEVSPRMLALARQRAADLGRDVDLREGDAEHLPFGDGAFDTVVCALGGAPSPTPGGRSRRCAGCWCPAAGWCSSITSAAPGRRCTPCCG